MKKVMLEVPNAPVAMRVKRVRVTMVRAKLVRRANLVHPMIQTLLLAHRATLANTKKNKDKPRVTIVFWDNTNPSMEAENV
jgi:hypothetical protein